MYTTNLVDYYYSFFTSKKDIRISDNDNFYPINLCPKIISIIQAEDIEQNSSIMISWGKEAVNQNNNLLSNYTFDTDLN